MYWKIYVFVRVWTIGHLTVPKRLQVVVFRWWKCELRLYLKKKKKTTLLTETYSRDKYLCQWDSFLLLLYSPISWVVSHSTVHDVTVFRSNIFSVTETCSGKMGQNAVTRLVKVSGKWWVPRQTFLKYSKRESVCGGVVTYEYIYIYTSLETLST